MRNVRAQKDREAPPREGARRDGGFPLDSLLRPAGYSSPTHARDKPGALAPPGWAGRRGSGGLGARRRRTVARPGKVKSYHLLVVALVALTGCATAHRNPRMAGVRSGEWPRRTDSILAPTDTASATREGEPRLLSLGPHGREGSRSARWKGADTHGWRLLAGDAVPDVGATAPDSPRKESLFSGDYWKLVGLDVKETVTAPARWETREWLVLGGVAAGIGTAAVFDKDIQKAIQRNRNGTMNRIFDAAEPFGAEYAAGVVGAFYVGGEIFQDARAKSVALDGLSATIIASGLILQPLKYGIGRSRPGVTHGAYRYRPFGGSYSFPSGHATEAFAVATVVAEHYDSLWARVISYGLASAVGYARLNGNAHWASDVLAGAALGVFVGHVVVRFNQEHRRLSLQPILGPHMQGVQVSFSF